MMDPEIGEKVTINGITYECKEPEKGDWMWHECDLWLDCAMGCIGCEVLCNAYYRRDGKHIILKRTSK